MRLQHLGLVFARHPLGSLLRPCHPRGGMSKSHNASTSRQEDAPRGMRAFQTAYLSRPTKTTVQASEISRSKHPLYSLRILSVILSFRPAQAPNNGLRQELHLLLLLHLHPPTLKNDDALPLDARPTASRASSRSHGALVCGVQRPPAAKYSRTATPAPACGQCSPVLRPAYLLADAGQAVPPCLRYQRLRRRPQSHSRAGQTGSDSRASAGGPA
ncbi:hypothetical protein FA95DRAFT_1277651 [Auriscalpium vulgare]|uniref:Uncharacterized protein n=1 Tax=Auriscalpium vulgare TaxID=40419 RepID=A0ACB8RTJ7_9AGAM|nr:hypothetical protein FA95DRAFT_1277651 [Auriscalpium vulgare]